MEVVEDESIATANAAASKFYVGKPPHRMEQHNHHRTIDTTMSSSSMMTNLSAETHPPSTRGNKNPFGDLPSSSGTVDSRHDSPREDSEDAMMTAEDGAPSSGHGFVLPAHSMPASLKARVITGDSRASSGTSTISGSSLREEKVALAPRFGKLEGLGREQQQPQQRLDESGEPVDASLFSLSGSMSSEFLEQQQQHPDHQQEYLHRDVVGMNSPTSTTARVFLREVQCPPPLPSLGDHEEPREGAFAMGSSSSRTTTTTSLPLHQRFGNPTHNRPPFHPPSSAAANSLPSPSALPQFSSTVKISSHPTLPREHLPNASSPSPTNTIPGVGSFSCDRDKPVISRCFAWSQDSQDDRRITKRARTGSGLNGMTSSASSPLSTDTNGVMSPSSALETIRGGSLVVDPPVHPPPPHPSVNDSKAVGTPSSASPTKVHWEEKVEHSNELMSRAVDPQVLFGVKSAIQIATKGLHDDDGNQDVAMGDMNDMNDMNDIDLESAEEEEARSNDLMPPPIANAQSASHYSFDSL